MLRHFLTRKGVARGSTGSHLSSGGVRLARRVGDTIPACGYVAVGDQPRHLETAIALGFAVNEQVSWPSGYVIGQVAHHDQWSWDLPFIRYAELLATGAGLADVVRVHLAHWQRILSNVTDGEACLVVSSGGSIEPVLVGALPAADHRDWGGAFHQLEGATLTWTGSAFTGIRFHRRDDY